VLGIPPQLAGEAAMLHPPRQLYPPQDHSVRRDEADPVLGFLLFPSFIPSPPRFSFALLRHTFLCLRVGLLRVCPQRPSSADVIRCAPTASASPVRSL
jgi:hypothetical protein